MIKFVAVAVIMASVEVGCTKCRQPIIQGNFFLCIIKKEEGYYLIADDESRFCCDRERQIPILFSSEGEAEAAQKTLVAEIKEYGDIAHLTLSPLEGIAPPTLH